MKQSLENATPTPTPTSPRHYRPRRQPPARREIRPYHLTRLILTVSKTYLEWQPTFGRMRTLCESFVVDSIDPIEAEV